MKIKGIVFDLDGVLLFTDKYHYLAWKSLADRLNIPFDEKVNDRLRGVSRMDSLNIVLSYSDKTFTEEEKLKMADEKNEIYRGYLQKMTPNDIEPSTRETLLKLKEMGLKLAVGSSSKNTPLILERTDMKKYFDAVADGNCIKNSKPDPEVFLKAVEFINLSPSECIVVEDADAGIEAANRGKFISVGIGNALTIKTADYRIQKLSELLDIVINIK